MAIDNPEIQLVCFTLGENLFAVDIMRIREITLPQKFSGLPAASQLMEGVINLRGAVIPVMNMRKRFDMSEAETGRFLIVSLACQTLALAVDDVLEIITVQAGNISPPLKTAGDIVSEHLLGVCLSDDRVILILDIDSLIDHSAATATFQE